MESSELVIRSPTDFYKCQNGHRSKSTEPFCSKCGGKMSQELKETYIPSFVEYAKSIREDTDELFESWVEDWKGISKNLDYPSFGFYRLQDDSHVFGVQIANTGDLMYSEDDAKSVPVDIFPKLEMILNVLLSELFGAKAPSPKVYLYGTAG
jgi:hypothetical protein